MSENAAPEGTWNITVKGPTGKEVTVLELQRDGDTLTGTQTGRGVSTPIENGKVEGNTVSWTQQVTKPMKLNVTFIGEITGNDIAGKVKVGMMSHKFSGSKDLG
ncbi:hypothetical protein IB286_01745 [Spongiibacter sp. KMU-158]|uniref:Uncharacterized protein n=1 Tax=Spongiibacter pelagi TaxID=2760804 RepID=A0A927C140_9GAMM|nr:hypothetical protein [Spongiibacter pelagi]MBD2857711.1 hypothetical protein [Spongiibacter pelagi]